MENTIENAQIILSNWCSLNHETPIGIAILKAMVEYGSKVNSTKEVILNSKMNIYER